MTPADLKKMTGLVQEKLKDFHREVFHCWDAPLNVVAVVTFRAGVELLLAAGEPAEKIEALLQQVLAWARRTPAERGAS